MALTKLAQQVILEELERMLQLTFDTSKSDYAVLTGVQIHGQDSEDYVWPRTMYAVVDKAQHVVSCVAKKFLANTQPTRYKNASHAAVR